MQAEAETWSTALFNRFLAGPLDTLWNALGVAHDHAHPWETWLTMEILVVAIILVLFAMVRSRLSVENPGKLQLTFEAMYKFVDEPDRRRGGTRQKVRAVLRGALRFYSVHESDRRHSRI